MSFVVVIEEKYAGYVSTVIGIDGLIHHHVRAGLTPYAAACTAMNLLHHHNAKSWLAGEIVAPPEVMEFIPVEFKHRDAIDKIQYTIVRNELTLAAIDMLKAVENMHELFGDDEPFCKAYRRLKAAVGE